jgi:putative RecB family exonuclease
VSSTGCRRSRARRRPGARWCTRFWSGSSTPRPPSARRPGRSRWSRASGTGCASRGRRSRSCSPTIRRASGWRWLGEAEQLVERWFTLEDPSRLEPAERELFVEAELESGLRLRGIIDRVDVAPTGEVRIVDYKTGKAPRPEYSEGALFQMKFYALVVWRLKNVVPRRLQLVYLGSGQVLTYDPVLADLERVERKLLALWEAIRLATETGDWRPRPTKLCGWCDHQAHCPEFGGTPPPYPLPVRAADLPGQPVRAAESGGPAQGRMGPD